MGLGPGGLPAPGPGGEPVPGVGGAISRAHEIVTAPVVVAASSSGCRPSSRICRTAALASLRPRCVSPASQVAARS